MLWGVRVGAWVPAAPSRASGAFPREREFERERALGSLKVGRASPQPDASSAASPFSPLPILTLSCDSVHLLRLRAGHPWGALSTPLGRKLPQCRPLPPSSDWRPP